MSELRTKIPPDIPAPTWAKLPHPPIRVTWRMSEAVCPRTHGLHRHRRQPGMPPWMHFGFAGSAASPHRNIVRPPGAPLEECCPDHGMQRTLAIRTAVCAVRFRCVASGSRRLPPLWMVRSIRSSSESSIVPLGRTHEADGSAGCRRFQVNNTRVIPVSDEWKCMIGKWKYPACMKHYSGEIG